MITVNKLIEELLKLKDLGYGELVCIYSADDEGNSYHKVINQPSEFIVEDLEEHYLESNFEYDENDKILDFKPNCIIIN